MQTLDESVADGDTVGAQLNGTGSIRFLGIDSPEKSFEQPLGNGQALNGPKWEQYLTNPFANGYPAHLLEPPSPRICRDASVRAPRRTITRTRWPRGTT